MITFWTPETLTEAEVSLHEKMRHAAIVEIDAVAPYSPQATPDFEVEDSAPLSWEDGLSDDEIEEGRRELEKFHAKELQAAAGEVAQMRRDQREHFLASGMDIVDYCSLHADTPEAADQLAKELGFKSVTWNDQRNVHRREKAKRKAPGITSKRAGRAALKAIQERATNSARNESPAVVADAVQRVTGYFNELAATFTERAAKLQKSRDWQLAEIDKAIEHYTSKGKSEAEALKLWERAAIAAADAKVRDLRAVAA